MALPFTKTNSTWSYPDANPGWMVALPFTKTNSSWSYPDENPGWGWCGTPFYKKQTVHGRTLMQIGGGVGGGTSFYKKQTVHGRTLMQIRGGVGGGTPFYKKQTVHGRTLMQIRVGWWHSLLQKTHQRNKKNV